MLPLVYQLLHGDSGVSGIVGTRIYRHGDAPQDVQLPYITWSVTTATPENVLSGAPRVDAMDVQVNCWGNDDADIEHLGECVRDAIESAHHITDGPTNGRDPETMRYRISFIFTFWNDRGSSS